MTERYLDRRSFVATTVGLGVSGLAGCGGEGSSTPTAMDTDTGMNETEMNGGSPTKTDEMSGMEATETPPRTAMSDQAADLAVWRTTELTDVLTDETFTIASLDGPAVIQSFAVWCPKCLRQSKNLRDLGDSYPVVSLNTDPNEDASKVKEHAEENGFDWRFAVSPPEMTESLVEAFGSAVTVAPSTPIVVACGSGEATFMSGSIASATEVERAANEC